MPRIVAQAIIFSVVHLCGICNIYVSNPLFCMCWDIQECGYWCSIDVVYSNEQVQCGGVAVVNIVCCVST